MDTLLRFGSKSAKGWEYVFDPERQVSLSDNFKDMVTATTQMPGMSGGFSSYGDGPLPGAIGSVSYTFWRYFDGDGTAVRDAIAAMTGWGLQRLWKQPESADEKPRFCWAYINNEPINFNAEDRNQNRQRITITFHVPDPFWHSWPIDPEFLNTGLTFDDAPLLAGWQDTTYYVQTAGTIEVDVRGSAAALPVIRIEAEGSVPAQLINDDLIINDDWIIGGSISGTVEDVRLALVDRDTLVETHVLEWAGTVGALERLKIDCGAEKVIYEDADVGNVSGWPQMRRTRAQLFELMPGINRVDVGGVFTGTVQIVFEYLETWR